MIKIIDGRGTGKSSRLMLMAKELGLPIACLAPTRLQEKARAYGITGIDFIEYGKVNTDSKCANGYLIDDLESFAQYFSRGKIKGYAISNDD